MIRIIGFLLLVIIVLTISLVIVLWKLSPGITPAICDANHKIIPNSIASLETVNLNGIKQWVLMRGSDGSKPVLLVLHGGPGVSEMLLFRKCLPELEKMFIVVNWDQPGAGKSYSKNIPKEAMCVDSIVSNTIELSEWLCNRFEKKKIYLLAHSWGTILGIKSVQKRPELYAAYIGIGQITNFNESERISYQFALETAKKNKLSKAVKALTAIGLPPYANDSDLSKTGIERTWITRFGADTYGKTNYSFLFPILLHGQEYTLREKCNYGFAIQKSLKQIWPTLHSIDFFSQAPCLNVPVYFCEGRHDNVVPSSLAERYYNQLIAPHKGWMWFENSSHNPHCEEPLKFVRYLSDVVLKESTDQ